MWPNSDYVTRRPPVHFQKLMMILICWYFQDPVFYSFINFSALFKSSVPNILMRKNCSRRCLTVVKLKFVRFSSVELLTVVSIQVAGWDLWR